MEFCKEWIENFKDEIKCVEFVVGDIVFMEEEVICLKVLNIDCIFLENVV